MLSELVSYATTRCVPAARRFGYLRQAIALAARERRCGRAWKHHLARSRSTIERAIDGCRRWRKVAVLGSGPLFDVPLESLAEAFDEVLLVDIVHLRRTRRIASRFDNVTLVEMDLTGVLTSLGRAEPQTELLAVPNALRRLLADPRLDLVVSLNVLSQLPLLPVAHAVDHLDYSDARAISLGRRIVQAHLRALAGTDANVCLVTDVLAEHHRRDGALSSLEDLLYGTELPEGGDAWSWDLAPPGEVGRGLIRHLVRAWPRWHAGRSGIARAA